MFEGLYSERIRTLVSGSQTDLQFTIELKEKGFDIRVMGGPIHKDEAPRYFQFKTDELHKCGLYLDIDCYKTSGLTLDSVPKLLKEAVALTWDKAERIASGLGL
jgi:hypothetical protein